METTQGNSLCRYLYLTLRKHYISLFIFYVFFFYKIGEQKSRAGPGGEWGVSVPVGGKKWQGKGIGG
jgi:hypothetical protein